MIADRLLELLDGVKRTGQDRWIAKCPAHSDRTASLSIREIDDGRVLCHCFAGCSVPEIVSAVGLDISDLFPPRENGHHGKPERRPFPASDVLRAIAFEALVIAAAATKLPHGSDRERVMLAAERIQSGVYAAGLHHGH